MPRYIDADALLEEIPPGKIVSSDSVRCKIITAPTADVQKVRHGKWKIELSYFVCPCCGFAPGSTRPYRYCPMCGLKMDEKEYDDYVEFIDKRTEDEFNVHAALAKYLKKHGYIVLKAWNIDLPEEVTPLIVPPQDFDQLYTLADDMRDIFRQPIEPLKTR